MNPSPGELRAQAELARVEARLLEVESVLKAVRSGGVDALVVDGPAGKQIFTLHSPEEPYRILAERMNEGAASVSSSGTILFCNGRLAEMLGMPAVRVVGASLESVLRPLEGLAVSALLQRGLEKPLRLEAQLLREDGSVVPVQLSVSCIGVEGAPPSLCLVATDLRHQKRIEDDVRRLNAELEQRVAHRTAELEAANNELEAFSYSVSHDLRAPLRSVDGFSKILLEEHSAGLGADGQRCLGIVRSSVQMMGRLIDELLSFARLSRLPLQKKRVSMDDLVREAIAACEPKDRKVRFVVGALPPCEGDEVLLRQVWTNLISNAVKFTGKRADGLVEIAVRDAAVPAYGVKDNGVGFDMRHADKLFQVFQRLHGGDEFEGTGVGLAIVQRIVGRHGGRVWAIGEPGGGAEFWFTIGGASG